MFKSVSFKVLYGFFLSTLVSSYSSRHADVDAALLFFYCIIDNVDVLLHLHYALYCFHKEFDLTANTSQIFNVVAVIHFITYLLHKLL